MNNPQNSSAVLVAGATGHLGGEICRQLIEENKQVKGLVRTSSDVNKISQLEQLGVKTVFGDLKDKASLQTALQGVYAVISTVSSTLSRQTGDTIQTVDDEGQINLIDAAVAAGVNYFVFISFSPMPGEFALQTAKRKVEEHLTRSGLNYTILQPTCFMEIWLGPAVGFDYVNGKATIFGEGKNRLSWIAIKDVASFAVAALDNPAARNRIFELGGPAALSQLEVVNIFETKQGKKFELTFVPEDALMTQLAEEGDWLSKTFAALMLGVAHGSEIEMTGTLKVFPIQLTNVNQYAEKVSTYA
ncbi:SDR family oxidoreductase [Segetibacter sp. 3557_3]|uniref:SDR family oxidoreductase n=1 Tax=Segetibacter sp. 3557_3 TaxID=2547429 RepID=UPI001058FEE6|nr:SDR family oxidoreductase [Segetibacter sp. 3557_3]TDH29082.1 SDR family oxidoreductase [Segetibacter sp. 3557_3]